MPRTKRIWTVLTVFWLYIWTVFAVVLMYPEPGISPSIVYYISTAPFILAAGLWWIRRAPDR